MQGQDPARRDRSNSRPRSSSRSRAVAPAQGAGIVNTSVMNAKVQLGNGQPVKVQLEATTQKVATTIKRVLHITFLIDVSLSMADITTRRGRCKLDVVLDNVQRMVGDVLQPDDRITILLFHKVSTQLCLNMQVSKLNLAQLRDEAYDIMNKSKGTSLYQCAVQAIDIMSKLSKTLPDGAMLKDGTKIVAVRKLVVFTDGQDNLSHKKNVCLDTLLERLKEPDVGSFHFTLIAVGNQHELQDAELLRSMMNRTKLVNYCSVITELADINKAFSVVRIKIKHIMKESYTLRVEHRGNQPVGPSLLNHAINQQRVGNGSQPRIPATPTVQPAGSRSSSRERQR